MFTGGTVSGSTIFTGGLSANTFSASTYLNLPLDVYVTGGTYSNGTINLINSTGGTFDITGLYTGTTTPLDVYVTGGTYSNGTTIFTNNTGGTFNVSGYYTGGTDGIFVTGPIAGDGSSGDPYDVRVRLTAVAYGNGTDGSLISDRYFRRDFDSGTFYTEITATDEANANDSIILYGDGSGIQISSNDFGNNQSSLQIDSSSISNGVTDSVSASGYFSASVGFANFGALDLTGGTRVGIEADINNNTLALQLNDGGSNYRVILPSNTPTIGDSLTISGNPSTGVFTSEWASVSGGTSVAWGEITGNLSDQTDLNNALDGKADISGDTFTGLLGANNGFDFSANGGDVTQIVRSGNADLLFSHSGSGDIVISNSGSGTILQDGTEFQEDITVPDEVYGPSWDDSLEVPTKNAIYDKIESLTGGTSGTDVYVTGGTFNGSQIEFTNITGGTFNVTGFTTTTGGIATWSQAADGAVVSGTTSNSVTYTQLISGGTMGNGSLIRVNYRSRTTINTQTVMRIYINTTPDLSGSPILVGTTNNSAAISFRVNSMLRTLVVKDASNNTETYLSAGIAATDLFVYNSVSTLNINWANDQYFVFALQNPSSITQVATGSYYLIEKI